MHGPTVTSDHNMAMQLARAIADSGSRVLVFSPARGKVALVGELITTGVIAFTDLDLPLFVDDTPNLSLAELEHKALQVKATGSLGAIVVDGLQHMHPPPGDDVGALMDLNQGIARIAEQLGCQVVVVMNHG